MRYFTNIARDAYASWSAFRIQAHSFGIGKKARLNMHLWFAISDQSIDVVKELLEKGADPNSFERQTKTTQLVHACAGIRSSGDSQEFAHAACRELIRRGAHLPPKEFEAATGEMSMDHMIINPQVYSMLTSISEARLLDEKLPKPKNKKNGASNHL